MAGISTSVTLAVPVSPPPEPPTADGHGGAADHDDHDHNNNSTVFFPLLDLLERFPDLFALKVLAHLDPIDRTFLAQTGGACRAAVAASDLPRAGTRRVEVLGRTRSTTRRVVLWVVTHRLRAFVESVERLAWAKASGCPWVARTCAFAAEVGCLEVLRWARENQCPWNEWTCQYAAVRGHLEVLTWAREHNCPWNSETAYWAAARGHLEVLRWAREHACPWSKRECEAASRHHPETHAWVQAQPE